jgi:hypothetical protein
VASVGDFVAYEIQICRDPASQQELEVRHSVGNCPEDGPDTAQIYPGGIQAHEKPGDYEVAESTWEDHLRAIRQGKRELLDIRFETLAVYEAVREDGSKLIFSRDWPRKGQPTQK